jgi:hypothetical protein
VIDVKMDIGILIQIEVHFLQLIQFNVHFLSIGCETCKCNPIGAYNVSCSVNTGQCFCKPGVTGQHCDRCLPNHYGFSPEGCSRK